MYWPAGLMRADRTDVSSDFVYICAAICPQAQARNVCKNNSIPHVQEVLKPKV